MSGYVEQDYIFEGGEVPQKFMESIYLSDWSCRHLRFVKSWITNWGDDLVVRVCAESQGTIDWQLQDWEKNKKSKEEHL